MVRAAAVYLRKENVDPKDFTTHVKGLKPRNVRLHPDDPNDFDDILRECMEKEKWNHFNHTPFFATLGEFVNYEKLEASYIKSFAQHNAKMKIVDWLEKKRPLKEVKQEVLTRRFQDYKRLSAQLEGIKIEETTVSYFKKVWEIFSEAFDLPAMEYILYSIAIGSIIVTWLIPAYLRIEEQIKTNIPYNEEFFKRFNIVCIMIDDEPIYNKVCCNGTNSFISHHNYEITNGE